MNLRTKLERYRSALEEQIQADQNNILRCQGALQILEKILKEDSNEQSDSVSQEVSAPNSTATSVLTNSSSAPESDSGGKDLAKD